ncbi:hypothetical protein ZIOFF_053550 [Zingiber officinale]|uniref:DUF7796 domain-containing protein n=1 Tax=Zingiber officinale TaxID=94328 RepID=A0A8J5FDB4_ZINOF|nr:hypothetical protein ZIOFF_053550 [Zingiber officinale]
MTGSWYGGLNHCLNVSNQATSKFAFSRLSLIPHLYAIDYRRLNSEPVFQAQLAVKNVTWEEVHIPFYVVSKRHWVNCEVPIVRDNVHRLVHRGGGGEARSRVEMDGAAQRNNLEVCDSSSEWTNSRQAKVGCSED